MKEGEREIKRFTVKMVCKKANKNSIHSVIDVESPLFPPKSNLIMIITQIQSNSTIGKNPKQRVVDRGKKRKN